MATGKTYNECDVITLFPLGVECISTNPSYTKQDGSITLNITGGTQPYNISWSNGNNTTTITNLGDGSYTAFVVDYYGDYSATTTCILKSEPPEVCNFNTGFTLSYNFFDVNILTFFYPTGTYNNKPYFSALGFGWNIYYSGNSWVFSQLNEGNIDYILLSEDSPITTFENGFTLCSDLGKPICLEYCVTLGDLTNCIRHTTVLFSSSTEGFLYFIDNGSYIKFSTDKWEFYNISDNLLASLSNTNFPPVSENWVVTGPPSLSSLKTFIDFCSEDTQCKCYSISGNAAVFISYIDCNFSAQTTGIIEDQVLDICMIPLTENQPYTQSSSFTDFDLCDNECDQFNPSNTVYNLCMEINTPTKSFAKYQFLDSGFDGNGYHTWSSITESLYIYFDTSLGKYYCDLPNNYYAQTINSNYPPFSPTNQWIIYGSGNLSITVTEGSCNPILN